METVVTERRMDPPIRFADMEAIAASAAWCMEQHRVDHLTSLLTLDGTRMICSFRAPDAESVRSVLRKVNCTYERVWSATVHGSPSLPPTGAYPEVEGSIVVVTRSFDTAQEFATIQDMEDRGAWCLEQHRVRFLRSLFSLDRRRMVCTYAAPDAESVRLAQREAGMPVEAVRAVLAYDARA